LAAIRSVRPSLERMTTSVGTPRASCAPMVCGPVPCDEPEPVVTLMPVVRSNSGNSFSYGPENPPEISTFTCADAVNGAIKSAARTRTIASPALHLPDEKADILGSLDLHSEDRIVARPHQRHVRELSSLVAVRIAVAR